MRKVLLCSLATLLMISCKKEEKYDPEPESSIQYTVTTPTQDCPSFTLDKQGPFIRPTDFSSGTYATLLLQGNVYFPALRFWDIYLLAINVPDNITTTTYHITKSLVGASRVGFVSPLGNSSGVSPCTTSGTSNDDYADVTITRIYTLKHSGGRTVTYVDGHFNCRFTQTYKYPAGYSEVVGKTTVTGSFIGLIWEQR